MDLPISFRKANEYDVPFIFNSWLKSYRNSHLGSKINSTIFNTEHHKIIEKLLKHSQTIIAHPSDDSSQIMGYICASYIESNLVIHYIYIKHNFRSLGIGKMLLAAFHNNKDMPILYTHHTKPMDILQYKFNAIHHPYLALTDVYIQSQSVAELIESGINKGRLTRRKPGRPKKTTPIDNVVSESKTAVPEPESDV